MITIFCGKSASGKDTLLKELINEGFEPLISTTSRPMRDGEQDGREYNFVSREEFEKHLADGKFIEHRSYDTLVEGKPDTWYYGMEKRELDKDKDYIVILDLEGAEAFKEAYKDEVLCVYVDVDDTRREEWAKGRGSFDKTEWDRRLADDNIKFSPENVEAVCDCVLHNDSDMRSLLEQFAGKTADFKTFDAFEKIKNALVSNDILYAYNKDSLKQRGFTDNQIADLQHNFRKGVDENTAIKFIGYACDLLDETTNTKTVDVLAKQGIYNVPTELAQKISAERKFALYEYSKSDGIKDIIGNALEDMEQLLSMVEQLQDEGVKVPIRDMDLAQMKADCKNLANLHWDIRKDDADKVMAEFTKSDVNISKNDVRNKDNIRKD